MGHKKLVPITREVLKDFYSKYPMDPVPVEEYEQHMAALEKLGEQISKHGSTLPETVGMETPTRIDDCFWRNRMLCEEIALSLRTITDHPGNDEAGRETCTYLSDICLATERAIDAVQKSNTESAGSQIRQFLPKDFRGSMMEMKRNATERAYNKQVEDLVKRGGTIRERYDLYLQQQWERRVSLAQMGELSGMFKFLVKNLGGIPQVLLDFAKEINAKLGPMEEQRLKYGPDLYLATTLGIRTNVVVALIVENAGVLDAERLSGALAVVKPACDFYVHHTRRVIEFLGDLFAKSPFFVSENEKHTAGSCPVSARSSVTGSAVMGPGTVGRGAPSAFEEVGQNGKAELHAHNSRQHHDIQRHSFLSDTFLSCVDHHSWTEGHDHHEKASEVLASRLSAKSDKQENQHSHHQPPVLASRLSAKSDKQENQQSHHPPAVNINQGIGTNPVPEGVRTERSAGPPGAVAAHQKKRGCSCFGG